jgi:hypothetical protein
VFRELGAAELRKIAQAFNSTRKLPMSPIAKYHFENAMALRFAARRSSSDLSRQMFYMMAIHEIRKARTHYYGIVLQ